MEAELDSDSAFFYQEGVILLNLSFNRSSTHLKAARCEQFIQDG